MKRLNPTTFRKTAICLATALAISLPGAASAGLLQNVKSKVTTKVVNVVQNKPSMVSAIKNATQNLPIHDIIDAIHGLGLKDQVRDVADLIHEMNLGYERFAGSGCNVGSPCDTFREDLKILFEDFLFLVEDVPALSAKPGLADSLSRASNLIDYVPPKALYLMHQALNGKLDEIRPIPDNIRQLLATLPPLPRVPDIMVSLNTTGAQATDRPICDWLDDKPAVDLVQSVLEFASWSLRSFADLVPSVGFGFDIEGEAGVAAAMAGIGAGVSFDLTEINIKIPVYMVAMVPEGINHMIDMSTNLALTVCKVTKP